MNKLVLASTLAIATLATQAIAEVTLEDMDASGGFSLEEMQAAYPDLTEEGFVALDTDESGELSMEEVEAAIEAGTLVVE
ncbi:hypothetical protein [Cognatishimia maritima]|uniref:EF hand n=1 Tax=Cognatishimia maritima TaxID=870908 RepID=A0A1M5JN87_9RHOB|nr:hypothetical protein [Cognatishimia maritima]SHG41865.1 hypothetical protein SAMN04488044_0722 [Cognatishimia maritima]